MSCVSVASFLITEDNKALAASLSEDITPIVLPGQGDQKEADIKAGAKLLGLWQTGGDSDEEGDGNAGVGEGDALVYSTVIDCVECKIGDKRFTIRLRSSIEGMNDNHAVKRQRIS